MRDATPLNQVYFFEFDTNQISESLPNPVRWTLFNYCAVSDSGKNIDCSSTHPGLAFEPQNVFGTTQGIPDDLINNRDTYYYLTKISFAFYLIFVTFTTFSLLVSFLACFSRLGGATAAFFNFLGLLFGAAASAMITAAYVMARNAFTDNDIHSAIGVKAFAFTWAAVAASLLSFMLLCCTCAFGRRASDGGLGGGSSNLKRESSFERAFDNDKPKGRGFFNVTRREEPPETFFSTTQTPAITPAHPERA